MIRAFGTTIAGRRHVERGIGCEDAFRITYSEDGSWVAAVLCDGCGSVSHPAEGAAFISEYLSKALLELTSRLDREGPGEWVIDAAVIRIAALREEMRAQLKGPIGDYAATVVAALVSDRGGFLLHIGDGIATALGPKDARAQSLTVTCQSDPENGEFINETFYLTGSDWVRHIRIIPVSTPSLIVLCTDGAQELLYQVNSPIPESLSALIECTKTDAAQLEDGLRDLLQTRDDATKSGDDIGCVILFNPGNRITTYSPAVGAPTQSPVQPAYSPPIAARRYPTKLSADPRQRPRIPQNRGGTKVAFQPLFVARAILTVVATVLLALLLYKGAKFGVTLILDMIFPIPSAPCGKPLPCES